MKQLPTIEEFYIEKWGVCPMIEKDIALHSYHEMLSFAKEFAKLHVQAALESAAIKAEAIPYSEGAVGQCGVDEDSILNAYPLEQIK